MEPFVALKNNKSKQKQSCLVAIPELFFQIITHTDLQSLSRLKSTCFLLDNWIAFNENNKNFNNDQLSSLLVHDFDTCTKALIACAHHNHTDLFEKLWNKHNHAEHQERTNILIALGWRKSTLLEKMKAYKGIPKNWSPTEELINQVKHYYQSSVVKILLAGGADVHKSFEQGFRFSWNPSDSSINRLITIFSYLKEYGFDFNKSYFEHSRTCLMLLCQEAVVPEYNVVIKWLLKNGITINAQDINQDTALNIVMQRGDIPRITLLLEYGANVNVTNKDGLSPLHYAVSHYYNYEYTKLLLSLRKEDIHIDVTDNFNTTPLMIACQKNEVKTVELLLKRGAQLYTYDKMGNTPFHRACCYGAKSAIAYLLAYGIDINIKNKYGRTGLHCAAWSGQLETVQFLCAQGIDVHAHNELKRTALHEACLSHHNNYKQIYNNLVSAGINEYAKDTFGETAQQLALRSPLLEENKNLDYYSLEHMLIKSEIEDFKNYDKKKRLLSFLVTMSMGALISGLLLYFIYNVG